mmetsp:Transcript_1978/g.7618  ORF Transcript_1978/g.7618 Transcript_1978/m.7618 type:complete len:206 (+) Transcript_1978:848-1465(+)
MDPPPPNPNPNPNWLANWCEAASPPRAKEELPPPPKMDPKPPPERRGSWQNEPDAGSVLCCTCISSATRFRGETFSGGVALRDRSRPGATERWCTGGGGGARCGRSAALVDGTQPYLTRNIAGRPQASKMSVAVAPSCDAFQAPTAESASAASNGYSCSVGWCSFTFLGKCAVAVAHFTARCCISPGTDFFARNVSSRCGFRPAA